METLVFTKVKGAYEATFTSPGLVTVQLERETQGMIVVLANLPGMPPRVADKVYNPYDKSVIFAVNLPVGVEVTLRSDTDVTEGMMMQPTT